MTTLHNYELALNNAMTAIKDREVVKNVYLVACGGSYSLMMPNQYIINRESANINAIAMNAREFTQQEPKALGKQSIVILCSHSGTTPETVEAAKYARAQGALTLALTIDLESPLAKAAEHVFLYEHTPLEGNAKSSAAIIAKLVFGLLKARENNPKFDAVIKTLDNLPEIVEKAKQKYASSIIEFGQQYKREPVIYTMASGCNYGVAYAFSICLLMEMSWVHSQAIHAGEYFHGPFEITYFDVPFITLLGLDETRPQEERALAFAKKYTNRLIVIDAKDFDITDSSIAGYIAHHVFSSVLRAYAAQLADDKGHPLTVRRYMWKMEY